jgi:multiple sugar transport system substrate-binding protein/putative aldouronate transport system substrate-binding protein
MKLRKLLSTLLVVVLIATILIGCTTPSGTGTTNEPTTKPSSSSGQPDTPSTSSDKTITIEMFNVAANYQGLQSGWFAKVFKDGVNIELNVIAPQVAGDAIYQTRASAGNLGDLVLLERSDFADCVKTGLVREITNEIKNCPNLMEYKAQIDVFNESLEGNEAGKTYGIPVEMTNTSPTSYSQDVIYSSPMLRWDLYSELGYPEMENLDDLLDVLAAMKEAHPTNEAGDPAYPFSLWPDWDGGDGMMGIANVVQLTTWYGEKIKQSVIVKPDDTFTDILDKNASYYKITNFLNKAYLKGLVDPDSGTQNWDSAVAKMSNGQVYLMWYSWQVGFWNSQERLQNGNAFIFVPVKDQIYYADSDSYYGSGRILGVGSSVDDEKYQRIMEFLDWYASDESVMYQHCGIEGFNYEVGQDGRYYVKNDNALMDNLPVPEEWGGGGYNDGFNKFNQWIVASISTNPKTGEPYNTQYWSTYKESIMTDMKRDWAEKFGAPEPVDYMKKNNVLSVSPNVSITLPSDPPDISVVRNQCEDLLEDFTWRMIFAKNQAEFDSMWDQMTSQLNGLGFQDLIKHDKEVFSIELAAKKEAKAAAN